VRPNVTEVARQLATVVATEDRLRSLLDEILGSRRALDRDLLTRLDDLLHGPADAALDVLDDLATVERAVLLAAMRTTATQIAAVSR